MIPTKKIIQLSILVISIAFIVCENDIKLSQSSENIIQENAYLHSKKNYSYSEDIKSNYEYSVSGIDYDNNKVYGEIDLDGQNGFGTLIRDEETKIEIVVENISNNKILAIDMDGNEYKLKIN